ncbi:MAG: hypothetical protein WB559_15085 [Candidatus Acidiferrales bacterium]
MIPKAAWQIIGMFAAVLALLSFNLWYPVPRMTPAYRILTVEEMWALGALSILWAFTLAYAARKFEWAPRTCIWSGVLSFTPVPLFLVLGPLSTNHHLSVPLIAMVVILPAITGHLCRRLVYPHLSDEEANEPEPPITLFRK